MFDSRGMFEGKSRVMTELCHHSYKGLRYKVFVKDLFTKVKVHAFAMTKWL